MENSEFSKFSKNMKRSLVYGYSSVFLGGLAIGFLGGYYVPSEKRLNSLSLKSEGRERTTPSNLNTTPVQSRFPADYTHTYDDEHQVHSKLNQEASVETEGNAEMASSAEWSTVDSEHVWVSSEEEITKPKQLSAEENTEWMAVVDEGVTKSEDLQKEAWDSMGEAAPAMANYLDTLSPEEQRDILEEAKTKMYSLIPPEVQGMLDDEVLEQGWEMFLGSLGDHGYEPPY